MKDTKKNPLREEGINFFDYSTSLAPFDLLIHLSTDPIPKEPKTNQRNALKMNSLITRSFPNDPVTMSATAKIVIITNAKKPTTLFSLIELLSLNKFEKNFFMLGSFINYKYRVYFQHKK
jgi:hypothetical protein